MSCISSPRCVCESCRVRYYNSPRFLNPVRRMEPFPANNHNSNGIVVSNSRYCQPQTLPPTRSYYPVSNYGNSSYPVLNSTYPNRSNPILGIRPPSPNQPIFMPSPVQPPYNPDYLFSNNNNNNNNSSNSYIPQQFGNQYNLANSRHTPYPPY